MLTVKYYRKVINGGVKRTHLARPEESSFCINKEKMLPLKDILLAKCVLERRPFECPHTQVSVLTTVGTCPLDTSGRQRNRRDYLGEVSTRCTWTILCFKCPGTQWAHKVSANVIPTEILLAWIDKDTQKYK